MAFRNILLDYDGPVATITINRPERMNSINVETVPELLDALREVGERPDVRVLVITGAGERAFCAGADVADMGPREAHETNGIVTMYLDFIRAIRELPIPVIAKVKGVAAGGGACTAIASDIRIVSERARFGFVFTGIGLAGADMGATYFLPRMVGLGKATELLYGAEVIDAAEALRIGLVNRVVAHEEIDRVVDEYARKLAAGPPLGLKMTKRALNISLDRDREAEFDFETYAQTLCLLSSDHLEGAQAFREKRPAVYMGR